MASSYEKKKKGLADKFAYYKEQGNKYRKLHEHLSSQGKTRLDYPSERSLEKHYVKEGRQNSRFGQHVK